jgi:hypothetical protein
MKSTISTLTLFIAFHSAIAMDLGVGLFSQENLEGTHIFITENWNLSNSDKIVAVSSIRVPRGWEICVYQLQNFKGDSLMLKDDWSGTGPDAWKWKSNIRSVRILKKDDESNHESPDAEPYGRVVLYDQKDFAGNYLFVDEDWEYDASSPIMGIHSIQLPRGWEIYAYQFNSFEGDFFKLSENWGGSSAEDWKWSNSIRSIRIVHKPEPSPELKGKGCVKIFEHSHYEGESRTICNDWTAGGQEGDYWNDKISSLKVDPGWVAIVYEHANYQGRYLNLRGGFTVTRPDAIWNDRISSIRIIPEPKAP